jgi:hypothetical protein
VKCSKTLHLVQLYIEFTSLELCLVTVKKLRKSFGFIGEYCDEYGHLLRNGSQLDTSSRQRMLTKGISVTSSITKKINYSTRCLLVGTPRTYFRAESIQKLISNQHSEATRRWIQTRVVSNQKRAIRGEKSAWELGAEETDWCGRPSSCLIAKVIHVWLVKCSNEVA